MHVRSPTTPVIPTVESAPSEAPLTPPGEPALPPQSSEADVASSTSRDLGGRSAASPSWLAVRSMSFDIETELGAVRTELASVMSKIATAQKSLDEVTGQIDRSLSDAGRARDDLSRLHRELDDRKTKRGVVGGIATVLGFMVGGPLGGALGNLAGFGTLYSVEAINDRMKAERSKLAKIDSDLAVLYARRQQLSTARAPLDKRAAELKAKDAELAAKLKEAAQGEEPAVEFRKLNSARKESESLLAEAKSLLGDYTKLTAKAIALGIDVEQLKTEVTQDVERLEKYLAKLDRALESALFSLTFAVIGAASGIGLLTATQAQALRTVVSTVKLFEGPSEDRITALANILLTTVVPSDAPLAKKLATALVGALAATANDRASVKESLTSAVISESQRAWITALLELPETTPVLPLIQAILKLSIPERETSLALFKALTEKDLAAPAPA
jgi:hypothetical protein